MTKPFNVILIGRSGSGKGTQAELLTKKFSHFYYLATGDLFRDLAKSDSDSGKRVKKILDEGGLPMDDLATTMWMHNLAYNLKEEQGLLADGFPRRLPEAKSLDAFLEFLGRINASRFILIDISHKEAFGRLEARGRVDDTNKAITGRMNYYEEKVVEVVKYYKALDRLTVINGEQSIMDVHSDMLKALGQ
ncbi:MAG: nucleoside monophosphate kinase [Candidatus Spechtbacterales bacterium]